MNGGIYSTGNEIVDENAKLNISGNIIPQVWYRTIIRESGKPNLTAIIILADIVYWYKPTEIRDEGTGQVIGVRKKFKSDSSSEKLPADQRTVWDFQERSDKCSGIFREAGCGKTGI